MATVTLGTYLWRRIREIGVESILGVPGDFNLWLLDYLYDVEGLKWVGNSNELNAAYAADGYARAKGIPGVFVTTHGVGELSAINGVAGSQSEQVKTIHIVGQTPRFMQEKQLMIHHSIHTGTPDHGVYKKISTLARVDAAELWDVDSAPREIDRVIRECFLKSGPVYIFMPLDLCHEHVPASLLDTKIDTSLPIDQSKQTAAAEAVKAALYESKQPCLFVDVLVSRHNSVDATRKLADHLTLPTFSTITGKAIVDETSPYFVGIYHGGASLPGIAKAIEACDLVLTLGTLPADSNTAGFSRKIKPENSIEINSSNTVVKGKVFEGVYMKPLLEELIGSISPAKIPHVDIPKMHPPPQPRDFDATHITQSWLWPRIGHFLRPGDRLLADTGTATFGLPDGKFCENTRYIVQQYYGSIGWATPATLGIELASRELHASEGLPRGRTILVTGDGSLQLTIQEIGTMIREKIKPIIMIINNRGYTIERVIQGAKQSYNDIPQTNYEHLLQLFAHPNATKAFRSVRTKEEFEAAAKDPALTDSEELQVLEIVMDPMDAPRILVQMLAMRGPDRVKYLEENGFLEKNEVQDGKNGVNGHVKVEGDFGEAKP